MTPLPGTSKRLACATCQRPQRTCICRWITPIRLAVEVVVLQHPLEVHSAKGSARLLHLSLLRSRMLTGETFDESELRALLTGPFDDAVRQHVPKHPILLYPESPDDTATGGATRPALTPEQLREPSQLRLIVLDGTWRKSRKMLHLNPLLQNLPRLSLQDLPASRYVIRKAHRADQLSTLEAACLALVQLEGDAARFLPLLDAFDGFVAQQLGHRDGKFQT